MKFKKPSLDIEYLECLDIVSTSPHDNNANVSEANHGDSEFFGL